MLSVWSYIYASLKNFEINLKIKNKLILIYCNNLASREFNIQINVRWNIIIIVTMYESLVEIKNYGFLFFWKDKYLYYFQKSRI